MSLIIKKDRISVSPFASIPALIGLPEIRRPARPVSIVLSLEGPKPKANLAEGCMVTKLVKYTHKVVFFVNDVCKGDPGDVVSGFSARKCCWLLNHVRKT
jgi:hypothetical protein